MKALYILLFSFGIFYGSNITTFTKLNNQIPLELNLNNFELSVNPKNNQKHYQINQIHEGIPVFGRNIKIHYNIYNQPSSMSSNFHNGKFENSIPTLRLDDSRVIIVLYQEWYWKTCISY